MEWALRAKKLATVLRQTHLDFFSRYVAALQKASFIGRFPHGKSWTGGTPGVHDLAIRPGLPGNPFEKVKNERFDGIVHPGYSCGHGIGESTAV